MKHPINSAAALGLVIRAVRKSTRVRQDDLAGAVRVSRQFTHDVEQGKPTVQLGRVLLLLEELGIALNVDIPDEASRTLATLQPPRPRARRTEDRLCLPAPDRLQRAPGDRRLPR